MDKVGGQGQEHKGSWRLPRSVPGVTGEDPFDASRVAGVEVLTALDDCSAVAARVGLRCSVISNIRWPIEHRSAMVYVDNVTQAAKAWSLRPVTSGGNVLLAEPESDVVFQRTTIARSGVIVAAAAQVAVDLLTGPGRNPLEGEELLDWMEHNEPAWRL
jgi:hypothetical protein